ncbi:MAG: LPS assembly protein LptD [Alphaproteobacteria bacterium]|nr:LPS assembly protein LptD [Alphaproteobacteria bacterium]
MRRFAVILPFLAVLLQGPAPPALAQTAAPESARPDAPEQGPVLFRADRVNHDRELGIVVATGNVEMTHGDRTLLADTVSYNQRRNLVTATGHVSLLEPTGDVLFADHVELTDDFKDGIIENLRVLMSDDARIAAVGGRRTGGNITEMRNAVYSPCRTCAGRTTGTPIWQIKAVKIVHNQKEQIVEYNDAFMEFFGVPVAYTPYLSHPDPTVKRKSGVLAPSYGGDSELGVTLQVPYYLNIAPDKDATLRPTITTNEGLVMAGEYRQRFTDGKLKLDASGTHGSKNGGEDGFRGHFFGDADFDLNNTWRTGGQVRLASDDTYLQRYDIDSTDVLENRLFVEGFRGRSYAQVEGYHWRGLRQNDDPSTTPVVAPLANFNFLGEPGDGGGRWEMDANMLVLTRTGGTDSRRLSLTSGWRLPHIARSGEVYSLWATLQSDAYLVDDVQEPGKATGDTSSGLAGRLFPRIGMDWRYPFASHSARYTQVVEPVVGVALSPNGGNPDDIPNEDSQDFEFDDTNLLSANRFTGLDRVEGGQRLYYGMRFGVYGGAGGASSVFVGQSYRPRTDDTFAEGSGLSDHFSDIVGSVQIKPLNLVDLDYRFRLDKDDLTPRRNEVQFSIGPPALRVTGNYLFVDQGTVDREFGTRSEISGMISSQITRDWRFAVFTRRDLEDDSTLNHGFQLTYLCDCFTAHLSFVRTFTQDRDVRPSDTILLRLVFKNLGEVETAG